VRPGSRTPWLNRKSCSAGRLPTNTESWVRAARPVSTGSDGSVRYGGSTGLRWTENQSTAGQQTRRWGSESSAASPAPGLAPATRPDRVLPVAWSGWQALPPHQSGSARSGQTAARAWMSEPGDGGN
jgi:hypothetical protein